MITTLPSPARGTEVGAAAPVPDVGPGCLDCGAPRVGAFCPACGVRVAEGRFTLRRLGHELLLGALDLNRGVLYTCGELTRRPGSAVQSYLAGRTGRFTNPFKYLLGSLAVVALAWWLTRGPVGGSSASGPEHVHGASVSFGHLVGHYSAAYGRTAWAALLVLTALFARILFRARRLWFAEHLLFATFTFAHSILLAGLAAAAARAWNRGAVDELGLGMGIAAGWYLLAATAFYGRGSLRALPRSALVLLLAASSYLLLGGGVLLLALRAGWLT